MKTVYFLIALFSLHTSTIAQTITSAKTGVWSDPSTWAGNMVPASFNDVVIATGHTVTVDINDTILNLSINPTAILHINSGSGGLTLTATGSIINSGVIQIVGRLRTNNNFTNQAGASVIDNFGNQLNIFGNLVNNGSLNLSHTSVLVCGDAGTASTLPQNISGTGTFNLHSIGIGNTNAAGVSLSVPLTIDVLQLFNGKLFLGSNDLTCNSFNTAGNTTSYVVTNGTGRLKSKFTGISNVIFPIGNSTHNPVSIGKNTGHHTFSVKVNDNFIHSPYGSSVVNSEWDIIDETGGAVSVDITLSWYTTD